MTCKSYLKLYTYVDIKEALNSRRPLKNDASDHHTKPQMTLLSDPAKNTNLLFESKKSVATKGQRMIQALTLMFNFVHQLLHDTFAW